MNTELYYQCSFPSSPNRQYTYIFDQPIAIGSPAIVKTPSSGFQIVTVNAVSEEAPDYECKWIVQLIDDTEYNERQTSKTTSKKRL